jgi:hypothetical protein
VWERKARRPASSALENLALPPLRTPRATTHPAGPSTQPYSPEPALVDSRTPSGVTSARRMRWLPCSATHDRQRPCGATPRAGRRTNEDSAAVVRHTDARRRVEHARSPVAVCALISAGGTTYLYACAATPHRALRAVRHRPECPQGRCRRVPSVRRGQSTRAGVANADNARAA